MPKHRWMNYTWAGERNADVRPNIVVIADTKIRILKQVTTNISLETGHPLLVSWRKDR